MPRSHILVVERGRPVCGGPHVATPKRAAPRPRPVGLGQPRGQDGCRIPHARGKRAAAHAEQAARLGQQRRPVESPGAVDWHGGVVLPATVPSVVGGVAEPDLLTNAEHAVHDCVELLVGVGAADRLAQQLERSRANLRHGREGDA
eukprot:scaffold883_cov128-Isochrysis_galbana.AAC.4